MPARSPRRKPRARKAPARDSSPRARPARPQGSARAARAARPAREPPREPAQAAMPAPVPGSYVHVELYSGDPAATRRFYGEVFGWTFEEASYGPGMRYTGYRTPGFPGGGLMDRAIAPPGVPAVLAYIATDDIDAAARRIAEAGGRVLQGRFEVPDVGWMLVFEDPGGVVQALWQAHPAFRPRG